MLKTILGLKGKQYERIVPALFAYQFNRIDMERFIVYVGDREEGLRIKDIARGSGYVMKNCKLYAWACHTARRLGEPMPKASAFDVESEDAPILKRLNLKHLDDKRKELFPAYSLKTFDFRVSAILGSREMRDYIGRFVTKKMTFLMKSYSMHRHDIEGHLREMAIVALYKQYPRFESDLHMLNVAKAQIHNKGQSFITSSTTKKRQRLQQNDDGSFEAVHVDISSLSDVEAPPQYGADLKEKLQALSQIEHQFPTKTREFLLCVAGYYNEAFSDWLQQPNDEAATTMPTSTYMKKVYLYFGTEPERVTRLYENIRKKIFETTLT